MFGQVGLQRKGLAAVRAGEGFICGVGLGVGPKVTLVREAFLADGAVEGLLAGVGSDVALQQPGAGEGFAAVGAFTPRAVGSHVHGKCGGTAVLAITMLALSTT